MQKEGTRADRRKGSEGARMREERKGAGEAVNKGKRGVMSWREDDWRMKAQRQT